MGINAKLYFPKKKCFLIFSSKRCTTNRIYFTLLNTCFYMNILGYLYQSMTAILRVNDSFYLQYIKSKRLHSTTRMLTRINLIKAKLQKI